MSEEFGADFISVIDEDGNELELELVGTVECDGIVYHAFFPAVEADENGQPVDIDADDEEQGLVILKVIEEDGEEIFSTLDTEEEEEKVYNLMMEEIFNDEDED